jgi:peptidoglycan hydrolase-like protein with peptidoglycan-binding domain
MEKEKESERMIKMVQRCLRIFYPEVQIVINGLYEKYTQKLVKTWQEQKGLQADGYIDAETWSLMRSKLTG